MMKKAVDEGMVILKLVKKFPDLWKQEVMKEFSQLAYEIMGDPDKYCPGGDEGFGVSADDLTKNVGQLLFDRDLPIMKNSSDITLQITHSEMGTQSTEIDNCAVNNIRLWKFIAIDGDGNSIMLRVDTSLNTAGNLLTPGTVVNIKSYLPIYFRYDDDSDKKCAIVVRNFEVVGRHTLSEEKAGVPKQRIQPKKEKKVGRPAKKTRTQTKETEEDTHSKLDTNTNETTCNGEQCSKHGVEFVMCLTQCVPVNTVSLPVIARECVFATRDLRDMSARDKRFLLYYYYATTIYQFHGKGNRVELPECLKSAVRELYPDEQD